MRLSVQALLSVATLFAGGLGLALTLAFPLSSAPTAPAGGVYYPSRRVQGAQNRAAQRQRVLETKDSYS